MLVTDSSKNPSSFEFTSDMEVLLRNLPWELSNAWDAVTDGLPPFQLYDDACRDGFGATFH